MKQLNVMAPLGEPGRELINDEFGSTSLGVGRVTPSEKNYSHVSAEVLMFVLLGESHWRWNDGARGQVLNATSAGAEAKWNEIKSGANGIAHGPDGGVIARYPCDGYFRNRVSESNANPKDFRIECESVVFGKLKN